MANVKLPGQAWAWRFKFGLREVERAYRASRKASDNEIDSINKAAKAHDVKVAAGQASWTEKDEEGQVVYDLGEHLGEEIYDAEQVLSLVRNAFVITLHHFVEQQIGSKLPNKKYIQTAGFAFLKTFGRTPKEVGLNELRLAANCPKHSGGSSAVTLYRLRPDLFDAKMMADWQMPPSYETLKITDAHVDEFFEVVKESVPTLPFAF